MSELRWILGLIGIVVVVALYVWGRRRATSQAAEDAGRVEPLLDGTGTADTSVETPVLRRDADPSQAAQVEMSMEAGPAASAALEGAPPDREIDTGKILLLYVRAASGEDFAGPELLEAFESEGLEFGKLGAFHQHDNSGDTVFSVANMHEPGSFPLEDMDEFKSGGIIAFMVLKEGGTADSLSRMIACARRLASILGGEVLDETGSTLTNQLATHMKEQAIEYLRKVRLESADSSGSWRS
jgi:cell division protein ZipA